MAETQAVAGAMHQIGSIAHAPAAGDNDPGVAAADRLHRLLNRFQSGAAHQIDGDRRSVDRQAGPQRGLARRVLPAAGGKHRRWFVDRCGGQLAAFKQAAHHRRAEVDGGKRAKAPRKLPTGVRSNNGNIGHDL